MNNRCAHSALVLLVLASADLFAGEQASDPVFDIPRLGDMAIDGNLEKWGDKGLQVHTLSSVKGTPWPKTTRPANLRIGWNDSGLVLAFAVHHAEVHEHDYVRHLFKGDSVEVFVAPKKGSRDRYMLAVAPGLDPKYPQPRHCFFPDPSEEGERDVDQLQFQVGRAKTDDGYTMELLLPWSNLNLTPKTGLEMALQVYVMESDGKESLTAMWHPAGESHLDPYAVHRIRLSERGSPMVNVTATAQNDAEHNRRTVRIIGTAELAGQTFEVKTDSGTIIGDLTARGTQSYGTFDLPLEQVCELKVARQRVPVVQLPPEETLQTIMAQKLQCRFKHYVFSGVAFPAAYLEGARNYRIIKTVFYDEQFNPVTSAGTSGRYGAVVTISDSKDKISTQRFRTLFRLPDAPLWQLDAKKPDELPPQIAANSTIVDLVKQTLVATPSVYARMLDAGWLKQRNLADPAAAALLACVYDNERGMPSKCADMGFEVADRQWWVGLKRKLYGSDKFNPQPFVCPRSLTGASAPVLREGTCQEAAIKPDAPDKIDAICQAAIKECGEPIGVCLARHGVVFFHRAYGEVDGQPMTVQTKCPMTSISKPLAATLMMMVIDQKLADIDDPVAKFLPPFKTFKAKTPLTIHHLYTHMNGMTGTWGDEMNDTEEVVGAFYPVMDVGNYSYNSIGFALGSKVVEQITGEALPIFARRHLLEPLGMTNTDVICSAHGDRSIPMDYARLGQMLLNRGAYGNMRFFSPETFQKMMPGSGVWAVRGMGCVSMSGSGLGPGAFGHGAAHSGVFRVDPAHDLLIVVTSAGTRKGFGAYYSKFFAAIIDGLAESPEKH